MKYPKLHAGDLRHRVEWQQATYTTSATGQEIPSWTTVGTYWANVAPLSGREVYQALQAKATYTHTITTRDIGNVSPTDRFVLVATGQVFNVESVSRISNMSIGLKIMVTEQPIPTPQL